MLEHRRFPRLASTHLISLSGEDDAWWSMGRTIDLSLTGLAIESAASFSPGSRVAIAISMDDTIVELAGLIVRCDQGRDQTNELAIALQACHRAYWQVLSRNFADLLPTT